jgi:hypothetical protein
MSRDEHLSRFLDTTLLVPGRQLVPTKWQKLVHNTLLGLRNFALTVLAVGGIQILIALVVWPIVFRAHPLGLSMALSLVGFGCWVLSFVLSFADRRQRRWANMRMVGPSEPQIAPPEDRSILEDMREQAQQAGCGFVLLTASLLPLGIAFVLRLRYDLRMGLTLSDIFPPIP